MKKILLIALSAAFISSCGPSREEIERQGGKVVSDARVAETTIDGCQYLVVSNSRGVSITHKANCKNHKYLTK